MVSRANEKDISAAIAGLLEKTKDQRSWSYWVGNDSWGTTIATDFENKIIHQFLSPNYAVRSVASSAPEIRFYTNPDVFDRAVRIWDQLETLVEKCATYGLRRVVGNDGVRKISVARDLSMIDGRYPLRQSASRILTLVNGKERWLFLSGEQPAVYFDTARAVRALLASCALSVGISVHGACFAIGMRGYLLCGAKRSGKTTNLFAALQNIEGARFVSNDRSYLYQRGKQLHVYGSPHSIPVRLSTLFAFPELVAHLGREGTVSGGISRGYAESIKLEAHQTNTGGIDAQEIFLSSRELVGAFETEELSQCSLAGVIFLRPKGEAAHKGWKRCVRSAPQEIISHHLHTQIETNFAYWDVVFETERLGDAVASPNFKDVDIWELNSWSKLQRSWQDNPFKPTA